ncbi:MAG TPA: hypothetical protein VFI96_04745 [Longimicrobiaceae bacterium]|nr:hypothetical protein [Longimicrobiaceae bacterium]
MSSIALDSGLTRTLLARYRAWRRERAREATTLWRIMRADRTDVVYADWGDEMLLGRYVGELLRGGADCVVIDKIHMTRAEADAIPASRLVS